MKTAAVKQKEAQKNHKQVCTSVIASHLLFKIADVQPRSYFSSNLIIEQF